MSLVSPIFLLFGGFPAKAMEPVGHPPHNMDVTGKLSRMQAIAVAVAVAERVQVFVKCLDRTNQNYFNVT